MDDEEIEETTRVSISVKDRIAKLKNASLPVSIVKKISASTVDVTGTESIISSMLSSSSDSNRGDSIPVEEQDKSKETDIENLRQEIADLVERHKRELAEAASVAQALRGEIQLLTQTVSITQTDLLQSRVSCTAVEEALRSNQSLLLEEQRLRTEVQEELVQLRKSVAAFEEAQAAASRELAQVALLEGRLQEEVRSGDGLRERIRDVEREMQEHGAASMETIQLLQKSLAARDEEVGVVRSELESSRATLQQIQEESVSLNSSIAEAIAQNQERETQHVALLARCDALQREASALEAALARAAADQHSAENALVEDGERRDRELAALREQLDASTAAQTATPRGKEEDGDREDAISCDLSDGLASGGASLSTSVSEYRAGVTELNNAVRKLRRIRRSVLQLDDAESSGGDGNRSDDPSTLSAPVLLQMLIDSKVAYAVDMEREIRANFELLSGGPAF
eukprot:gene22597-30865_t